MRTDVCFFFNFFSGMRVWVSFDIKLNWIPHSVYNNARTKLIKHSLVWSYEAWTPFDNVHFLSNATHSRQENMFNRFLCCFVFFFGLQCFDNIQAEFIVYANRILIWKLWKNVGNKFYFDTFLSKCFRFRRNLTSHKMINKIISLMKSLCCANLWS